MSLLPLNIPLDISTPLICDDIYWKRKCIDKGWNYVDYVLSNCNWKNAFVFRSVQYLVDCFISGQLSYYQLEDELIVFQDLLQSLKINGYKWFSADGKKSSCAEKIDSLGKQLGKLIIFFPNIKSLDINVLPEKFDCNNGSKNISGNSCLFPIYQKIFELKYLEKLTLIGSHCGPLQVSELVNNMVSNALTLLDLSYSFISDHSCNLISKLLLSSTLKKLILSNNNIGNIGAESLSYSLNKNVSLKTLDLSNNCISNEGAISFVECLKSNSCLEELNLCYNKLNNSSDLNFSFLLQVNCTLQSLDLSGNVLGKDAGRKLVESLQENKNILYMGIQFCGFRKEDEDMIYYFTWKNSRDQFEYCVSCDPPQV